MIRTELVAPVARLLRRHAEARGDKIAFSDAHGAVSYGELQARTANLAGHLQALGLVAGETAGIALPNSVDWIVTCLAVVRAGAIAVPISCEASPAEIAYRITDADCRIVVTTPALSETVATIAAGMPRPAGTIVADGSLAHAMASLPSATPRDSDDIDATSFVIYTSGTTGRPKGVLLTQRGMLWVTAACWAPIAGLSEHDVVLSGLPLYHSYALNLAVLSILAVGATIHIQEKFSTAETARLLAQGRFTLMPGVPTMFNYLVQAGETDASLCFPDARMFVSAGAIMPASLNRAFEARFGVPLLDGYGITETSTMVTMNWPHGGRVLGSCGLPVPGLATRIVDPADRDVEPGGEGELIVRGPGVMAGYHNKPDETARALREGWYYTGDLARADANGFLTITGRLKEIIIRGGQNIAPAEIEEVAAQIEGIGDCAVVGMPHEALGEVPILFVAMKDGHAFDEPRILQACRASLSAYKLPARVYAAQAIPRTGSGKIMRFKLRDLPGTSSRRPSRPPSGSL